MRLKVYFMRSDTWRFHLSLLFPSQASTSASTFIIISESPFTKQAISHISLSVSIFFLPSCSLFLSCFLLNGKEMQLTKREKRGVAVRWKAAREGGRRWTEDKVKLWAVSQWLFFKTQRQKGPWGNLRTADLRLSLCVHRHFVLSMSMCTPMFCNYECVVTVCKIWMRVCVDVHMCTH